MYFSVYMYKLKIFCISSAQNAKRTYIIYGLAISAK